MPEGGAPYDELLPLLQRLIMQPIRIGRLTVVMLDALAADHPADWTMPPHRHPWFEFNYVSEGELFTNAGGDEFRIAAGQSYLIPPSVTHSHRHRRGEKDDGFCLRWQILEDDDPQAKSGGRSEETEFLRCFSLVRPYALQPDIIRPLLALRPGMSLLSLQCAFASWLTSLYEEWRAWPVLPPGRPQGTGDAVVRQTLLYLNEYYASRVRVEEVADALHVSYRHLARVFRRETGLTVVEKLNDIRIRQAKKLLKDTDLPMRQIAAAVGLKNEFYLSALFRRLAMVTPSEFRAHCMCPHEPK